MFSFTLKLNFPRFLDRFRTMTNVMGDALGCAVVQSMCSKELAEMDQDTELQEVGEKS